MGFDEFWNAVIGSKRDADRVVVEFDLTGPRAAIDEWLGRAEQAAIEQGTLDPERPWRQHHARALDELCAAAEGAPHAE